MRVASAVHPEAPWGAAGESDFSGAHPRADKLRLCSDTHAYPFFPRRPRESTASLELASPTREGGEALCPITRENNNVTGHRHKPGGGWWSGVVVEARERYDHR